MPRAPIEYRDASAEVRAVFDDIKRTRRVDDVNNFWQYLAQDPALLARTWASVKEVMAPDWGWLHMDDRRGRWVQVFGRLKPGYTLESAKAPIQGLFT